MGAKKRRDLRFDATFEEGALREPWASELQPVHIDGCMLDETVFVFAKAGTVVSADLTENFATSPHWPTRLYLKAAGIHGKIGWPRPLRLLYRDHAATRRSLERLLSLEFDRLIVAHGDVIARDARNAVEKTFGFLRRV